MNKIPNFSAIDTNTIEGRYLVAALKIVANFLRSNEETALKYCHTIYEEVYKDVPPIPEPVPVGGLETQIKTAINRCSREINSHTPDFILAEYLMSALSSFEVATNRRDQWYKKTKEPSASISASIIASYPTKAQSPTATPRPSMQDIITTLSGNVYYENQLEHIVNARDNSNYIYYRAGNVFLEHHLDAWCEVSKDVVIDRILEHRNGREVLAKYFQDEKI